MLIVERLSLREAVERNGVKCQTLARYVRKQRDQPEGKIRMTPKYNARQIFPDAEEQCLCNYILECSKMCYGKSTKSVRALAYELAVANSKTIPESWRTNKLAGVDWLSLFMKRHPTLSIR